MTTSPKDRIALITGAGSGIGRQSALRFLEDGYRVILAGRTHTTLEATQASAANNAAYATPIQVDVTQPASVKQLFGRIEEQFGRLDVLFNNAGISPPGDLLEDLAFDDWQQIIATNLTGVFLCTQAAFRLMKSQTPQGGRIINNGSISAHVPRPNSAPYTASKHAVSGLTKSTALDGRKYNIACCQIDIGNAATSMVSGIQAGALQPNLTTMTEPTMKVSEAAEAVLFMANLPLETNVQQMTIMATQMPFIGRG
ncbi:MAG: SDR family oxidoreductase [Bacteroidota bacterium]